MDYKKIIDTVFQNNPALPCSLVHKVGNTKVYRIDTPTPLIVRVAQDDVSSYKSQAALQSETAAQDGLTARILCWETRKIQDQVLGIQVQTFIPGKPIEGYPNREQAQAIVGAVYKLQDRLCRASKKIGTNDIPSFHKVIQQIIPLVDDCPIKTAAIALMENERYLELISQPEQCLIYGDLWYKNLLLDQTGGQTVVRFIDIDPLLLGPKLLQPAILFSSYFLFYALLFEPNPPELFNLDELLSFWPQPLDKKDILLMMQVFPIGLGLRKEYQFSRDHDADTQDHRSTMKPFERSVQIINRLLEMA
jgi:hypothetical protein